MRAMTSASVASLVSSLVNIHVERVLNARWEEQSARRWQSFVKYFEIGIDIRAISQAATVRAVPSPMFAEVDGDTNGVVGKAVI